MRKLIFVLVLICLFASVSAAAEVTKFKDVSKNNWAAGAIYNLVKMGVVSGYPDGTFRGKQKISRYEVASFLSKLSDALGGPEARNWGVEVEELKTKIASLKKSSEIPITGSLETVLRYGNLLFNDVGGHGPVANYRLIASMVKDLGKGTSIKINLDTMDSGFYGGSSDLATRLIDMEGKLGIDPADSGLKDPIDLILTIGPGAQQHTDSSGVLPGEDGIVYTRPDTGVELQTKLMNLDVSGGYFSADTAASGKINTNRLTGTVAYTFNKAILSNDLELAATGDYFLSSPISSGQKDLMAKLDLGLPFSKKIKLNTHVGVTRSQASGMMVGAKLQLDDVWNTGTRLSLSGSKVGSRYITLPSQFDYAGLDYFDRPIENATVNIGGEVVQSLDNKWVLKGKGDIRLSPDFGYGKSKAKSRATAQVGLAYNIAPQTEFDAFYRLNQDPTISQTSDLTAVGMIYRF
ncbi:MAG: S-layer homology domain-containing protein [Candidatus Saganbacteria bacterium]|nr:S-layer homology domain-containing protein [Candidatus Saganbacteria bacterium]